MPVEHTSLHLPEIQSLSLEEILIEKAKAAYKIVQKPVLVDDVSLVFNCLGKLPGPFIKFFLKELGNEGLCKLASCYSDKSAVSSVGIGYADKNRIRIFIGETRCTIAHHPTGNGGFGFDPIIIPEGYTKTRASLNEKEYNFVNPRRIALEKLREFIQSVNQ